MNLNMLFLFLFFFRHDFHTSLTEINVNEKTNSLEISMRVFTDDLENALAVHHKKPLQSLEKIDSVDKKINSYLRNYFQIRTGGKMLPFKLIGYENETDVTWIYMEILSAAKISSLEVKNIVMTEIFDDQSNILNFFNGNDKKTLLFTKGDNFKELSGK